MSNLVPVEKLSKILDAIKTKLDTKLTATGIKNNADTTDSGYVLDARMGKSLGDRATTLETKISSLFFDTDSSGRWGFKTSRNGAVTSFTATGAASTIESSNLTGSRALASDGNGKVAVSSTTATELGYLHGVTGAVQTQINSLNSKASSHDSSISSLNSNLANFQHGVDALYNQIASLGVTPSGKTLDAIKNSISSVSNNSYNTGYANGKSNGYNEGYAAGKKVGSYTVASFTITSSGGSSNFATFDFGQYFSNYSDFLSHTICAVAGSDGSSGSGGSGFSIYNGSAHIYDNTRVEYPTGTSIRVRNYQGLPVGNTVNFICMFTG